VSRTDWFVVGARLFGLWVLYNGVSYAGGFVEHLLGIEQPAHGAVAPGTYLLHAVWTLVFAAVLLLKTRALARVLFAGDDASPEPARADEPMNGPPP
jgi:hypothetical protein